MRHMLLAFVSTAAAVAQPAAAQNPCPAGSSPAIIRLSKLAPGGSMDGARKAAADHAAWYASHGYGDDKVLFVPVLGYDRATDKVLPATDQFYTFHLKATSVPQAKHDAAWSAYVDEYNKNSTVVTTNLACMPD